jgi:hypothetical protein
MSLNKLRVLTNDVPWHSDVVARLQYSVSSKKSSCTSDCWSAKFQMPHVINAPKKKGAKMCQSRPQLLHGINNHIVRNMDESSTLKDLQFDVQLVLGGKRSLPVATLLEHLKVLSSYIKHITSCFLN